MSQAIIRAALESTLKTWADAQSPALSIAFENTNMTQQPAGAYLRAFVLPAQTAADDLERALRRYGGVFQVSIVLPVGQGTAAGNAIVSALEALFAPQVPIAGDGLSIFVLAPLSAAPAILEPDRFVIPCSLTYRADTTA